MQLSTVYIFGFVFVVLFGVCAFLIGNLIRDITTHSINFKKSVDHIWVEAAPKTGKGWYALVKLQDQKTGSFTYKDRQYFAGGERWKAEYPPGRSSLAQVTFDKCLIDPASSDMLTNITGKPTVDAVLVYNAMEQKDTTTAMQISADESNGGKSNKQMNWVLIGVCVVGVISLVGVVFTIKGQMGMEDSLLNLANIMEKLANTLGVH